MKMNNTLFFSQLSLNYLSIFYPIHDTRDSINKKKYDVIVIHREDIFDNFDKIKPFLKKNKTKIIVDISVESGCLSEFIHLFDVFTKKYKDYNFYLICDAFINYKFDKNVYVLDFPGLLFLSFFDDYGFFSYEKINFDENSIYKKENGFVSFNGSARGHRILLLLKMYKKKLLNYENGIVDFLLYSDYANKNFNKNLYEEFSNKMFKDKIINQDDLKIILSLKDTILPIKLDRNPNHNYSSEHRKIINLVSENVYNMDCVEDFNLKVNTFTEKTFIPFRTHQIPLFIALPNHASVLRKIGFDLFDDIIDYKYDNEFNNLIRMDLVLEELEKLLKMDLVEFYKKNYKRFVNNSILIYKLRNDAFALLSNFLIKNNLL